MLRTITCEECVASSLKGTARYSQEIHTALLIGCKVSESHYHLLSLSQTLDNEKLKISQKARQVSGTLPGGVYIVGLATWASPAQVKPRLTLLTGTLGSVWRQSSCGVARDNWIELGGTRHSLLLYYSPDSKKLRCMSMDMSDQQSVLQFPGAEVKSSSHELLRAETVLSFNVHQVIPSHSEDTADKLLARCISQCIQDIQEGMCTFKDAVPSDDTPVISLIPKHKSGNAPVMIDFNWKITNSAEKVPVTVDEGYQLTIEDSVYCRAYVHSKGTWHLMTQALKLDAVKSIVTRQDALLDELKDVQLASKQTFKLMFPRRLWFTDNTKPFVLTDYCFLNEKVEDAEENLKTVWGPELQITAEESCEEFKPQVPEKKQTQLPTTTTTKSPIQTDNSISRYLLIAAIAVLILALILILS